MSSLFGFVKRLASAINPPSASPLQDSIPIKFGILGAAAIAPAALISAAKSHPEVVVYAIAARDKNRAAAFAKKHSVSKVYGGPSGYQELLDDPEVQVVYNPLPNSLHYEWTMKALLAGKHVLLEKPSSSTAEETRKMFEFAEIKGLVLLEAFHYRFHPAIQRVKAIIDSGELGAIKHISPNLAVPKVWSSKNIRFNYALAGGALMDMGCYTLNVIRYLSSSDPVAISTAHHDLHIPPGSPPDFKPNVDRSTIATLVLPNDATATLHCDIGMPSKLGGILPPMPRVTTTVECEGGTVEIYNYILPTLFHSIKVTFKTGNDKASKTRTEKVYTFKDGKMEGKGEVWWTTYRYQLEAFVDKLKGRTPQMWVEKEDSVKNMECIEKIYAFTGLGSRVKSEYVLPE